MPSVTRIFAQRVPQGAQVLDIDLFTPDVIAEPQAAYGALREAGPAVWLSRHGMWGMGRYGDVRAALRDPDRFASGGGVAANPLANRVGRSTVLFSDGQDHRRRRQVMHAALSPSALTAVEDTIQRAADDVIERLMARPTFDGVRDFAMALPMQVVARLVGLEVEPDQLLSWSRSTFDAMGPLNARARRGLPRGAHLALFARRLQPRDVAPNSWAAGVFAAADEGRLTAREARRMIIDFTVPSLYTTILATAYLLYALGTVPLLWERIRENEDHLPAAVVEATRLASPVRAFTRTLTQDTEVHGLVLPQGDRVLLSYPAANRDPAQFPDPDTFSLSRRNGDQLGWGSGPHTCIGMHLAKLEMQALLRAMRPRVTRVEVGKPTPLINNSLQGIGSLPTTLLGARNTRAGR